MKKLRTTIFAFALSALGALQAATTGSYLGAAKTLSPSGSEQTLQVTLTKAYDPDDRTYDSYWGVYYVKVKVNRGKTCSIWCDGKSNESMALSEDYDPDNESLWASFDSYFRDGEELFVLTEDCWDMEEDPSSGWFYFYVDGDVGDTCTIHYMTTAIDGEAWEGDEPPAPIGTEENPEKITLAESPKTFSGTFIDGDYYYYFTVQAGRAYRFVVQNSTEANPIDVSCVDATCEYTELTGYSQSASSEDLQPSLEIRTTTAGTVYLLVSGDPGSFKMTGVMLRNRSIGDHDVTELNEGNGYAANFVPGRLSTEPDVWDPIVDERLFKATLAQGERAIFEVSNAATNLTMYLYDKNGTVLDMNQGRGGLNPYISYAATAGGTYYVGVCQADLEAGMEALGAEVTLQLKKPGPAVDGNPDEWDAADDTIAGATTISATVANDNVDINLDAGHGPHRLSFTDWEDIYRIDCQNGVSYKIGTTTEEPTAYSIYGEIFTVKDSKETSVAKGVVSEGGIVFKASASQIYYVRVYVNEGKGREYPAYMLRSVAYVPDQKLGYMTVNIKGPASAYWTYVNPKGTDKTQRKGGTRVLTWGNNTVTFATVKGFSHPENATHVMTGDEAEDTVLGVYNDNFDPLDNYPGGTYSGSKKYAPVKLTPSAKGVSLERTLYVEDGADWYSFTGAAGSYYKFKLQDVVGTPRVRVFGPNSTNAPCERVLCPDENTVYQILAAAKGTYYVVVDHEEENKDDWQDSSYTLVATSANVGEVKFAKAAVSFKKNTAYATLAVKRTAKDGKVRVKYATADGSAAAGTRYERAEGELVWENGDNKDKTIEVKLVPQLYDTYYGDVDFSVAPATYGEDEIAEDEYIPALVSPSSCTVTVTETTKAAPGTVAVFLDGKELPAKNAAVYVKAGESATLDLRRILGDDGAIGVTAATAAGTAKAGVDFVAVTENFEWASGEAGSASSQLVINTKAVEADYTAEKKFTVKLAKLSGKNAAGDKYASPAIASAAITVYVRNDKFDSTVAEYAKANAASLKASGVAIKESKDGVWTISDEQDIKATAKGDLAFTLTGPGVFTSEAMGDLVCAVGKSGTREFADGEEIKLYLGAGSQSVTFTAEAGCGLRGFYSFEKLEAATAVAPSFDKAVLPLSGAVLASTVSSPATGVKVFCLCSTTKGVKLGDAETEVVPDIHGNYVVENLEAGKKYSWRADSVICDGAGNVLLACTNKTEWSFTAAAKETAPVTVVGGVDAFGNEVESNVAGKTVLLYQGVNAALSNETAGAGYKLLSGKLPDGVKLDAKSGAIAGVPTKAGTYQALLQVTGADKVAGTTAALTFEVVGMKAAAGTFNGVLRADTQASRGLAGGASLAVTVTAAGKITGKAALAGKTYTFAKTGFDELIVDGATTNLYASVSLVQKVGGTTYTNTLNVTICENDQESSNAIAEAELAMNVPDATGKNVDAADVNLGYSATLYKDVTKDSAALARMAECAGYYTMVLSPMVDDANAPCGNGYLALTLDEKGKVKVAGALADGTTVSASALAGYSLADEPSDEDRIIVPIYVSKSSYVFFGEVILARGTNVLGEGCFVVSTDSELSWNNDSTAATYSGESGYALKLEPVGGWYNTIFNLQAHYRTYAFLVAASDELPEEALADGYEFVPDVTPTTGGAQLALDCAVNALNVDKRSLVKQEGSTKLYDLAASVNPWNVTYTYKRATGILSGKLSVWTQSSTGSAQKEISGLKHAGIMILSRDSGSTLEADIVTGGYFLMPVKLTNTGKSRTWNCSLPFNVVVE